MFFSYSLSLKLNSNCLITLARMSGREWPRYEILNQFRFNKSSFINKFYSVETATAIPFPNINPPKGSLLRRVLDWIQATVRSLADIRNILSCREAGFFRNI